MRDLQDPYRLVTLWLQMRTGRVCRSVYVNVCDSASESVLQHRQEMPVVN